MTTKMHFRTHEMNLFTILPQALHHSEFEGDDASFSLRHAKQKNHEKKLIQMTAIAFLLVWGMLGRKIATTKFS